MTGGRGVKMSERKITANPDRNRHHATAGFCYSCESRNRGREHA
jgi:hypothetical protein